MSSAYILWNILLGMVGLGLLSYAKVTKKIVPLLSGIVLLVLPYLTSSSVLFGLAVVVAFLLTYYLSY